MLRDSVAPYWVDEHGRRLPKQPCPRCGANVGPLRLRVENLRNLGWHAFQVERYQSWCGHGQEIIPIPQSDGTVKCVPIMGEAR